MRGNGLDFAILKIIADWKKNLTDHKHTNYFIVSICHWSFKTRGHGPHHSPEKTVQINIKHIRLHYSVDYEKKKPIIFFLRIEWFLVRTNLNPLYPRLLSAKFGWYWPIGSGDRRRFSNFVKLFSLFWNYLPMVKGFGLLIEQIWIPTTQGWFVPSLVEIGPVVLEKIFKSCQYIFAIL